MRATSVPALPLVALLAFASAGCSSDRPPDGLRDKLKYHISDKLRAHGFFVAHTDEDPRARPPTKYAECIKGLAFSIRHAVKLEATTATLSTWVFNNEKALAAAREPFEAQVLGDLKKGAMLYKWHYVDGGSVHAVVLAESSNPALVNQFDQLLGDLGATLPDVK